MTRQRIEALDAEIHALKERRETELLAMQTECDHPEDQILEAAYTPAGSFGYATPPFRVCKLCGYAEEGWNCGYWKLKTREEIPTISRQKADRDYVLKFYSQDTLNERRFNRDTEGVG